MPQNLDDSSQPGRVPAHRRRWGILLLATLALGCAVDRERAWQATDGPPANVLVVTLDTLRADHVGFLGYERDTTPVLDFLARRGTTFRTVGAQSNWTVPATATILTSLYPSRHGAGVEGEVRNLDDNTLQQLSENALTLGDLFAEAGYRTAMFSANPYLFGRFERGFETSHVRWRSADEIVDETLDWLAKGPRRNRPFFAYLQLIDLHHPLRPPERFAEMFSQPGVDTERFAGWEFQDPTAISSREKEFDEFRRGRLDLYDGTLRFVDFEIGRLLDGLSRAGRLEDTLVVVTSDHGEEFWENLDQEVEMGGDPRGVYGHGHGHSMFRELLDAILLFWGPSVPEGVESECAVRQLDIAPTILDLVGLEIPTGYQGTSLGPPLRTESTPCPELPLVAQSPAYGPDRESVRWQGLKLIERADGYTMLFDLETDPAEEQNLADERPDDVAFLRELLADAREGSIGKTEPIEFPPRTETDLRALGYIE